ncbi:hypothetical protein BWI97_14825 [Siphonobacter sp. BAB-5405]|uniref:DUF819 family protein n=1 Tax=Siphonobacter sp. BAB-5405 TaxID=1864825 RepID=UPI000C810063|nr:DUF819 family protein [Siphonobacter sp. BAB-5405]PMD95660.1 hypothetical protein BWI97_14825 [Siphonobacter sp. BAB-5405]
MISNYAVVLGILCAVLGLVFYTSTFPSLKKFYELVPPVLLCYFIPGLLTTAGVFAPQVVGDESAIYQVVSQYFLPATLVLFTLSMDLKTLKRLGLKTILVFLAGIVGVMLGGPLAVWIVKQFSPATVGGEGADAVWRGLATIAGSWTGGGANQAALKEIFKPSERIFSQSVAVDIIIGELWMAVMIFGAGKALAIDRLFKADASSIEAVQKELATYQAEHERIPATRDLLMILGVGLGVMGLSHVVADAIVPVLKQYPILEQFSLTSRVFWIISFSTIIGITLSFTPLRQLEHVGASRIGSVFLYVLIATIGLKMDLWAIADNPGLFAVGIIWISIHGLFVLVAARFLNAPFFFMAVGSQAAIGGPASAPVVAAAFHPSLAPVGVLLAILGYAIGTYCGYLTGLLMQWAAY